ncbi:MAG TPA: hypothetical protein H9815_06830, partial [Candidatus Ruania gallistercoris]|nr:hypothetical protein [Candidatus Ruania gallistercoris]
MTTLQPYALRVDGQHEPQGIVSPPSFSWRLRSEGRGARQRSHRITVHLLTPHGQQVQVWDSGEVAAADTTGVPYQGAPLQTSADYRWELAVTDEHGTSSTSQAHFATGIVHPDQ